MLAIALKWQRSSHTYRLGVGENPEGSPHTASRNMMMKAMAIFYFRSTVETLYREYQQEKYVKLEYESLTYKIADLRLEISVPSFTYSAPALNAQPSVIDRKQGYILLKEGKRIPVTFEFASEARDALIVKNSPFVSRPKLGGIENYVLPMAAVDGLWTHLPQTPQNSEESRVFQQVLRYLLDVSDLRTKKYLRVKKSHVNVSDCERTSLDERKCYET